MFLIDRVRRTLARHQLAASSTRVVAALSGGPDSVALVHILRSLHDAGDLQLVALAHLNHQLRAAADADERFCAGMASTLGLPLTIERIDVRAHAVSTRRSIEDAAHQVRYAFFDRAVAAHAADVVALGHTADDQAETVLLRLVRGAGARGLAAMYPRHGIVVRPLLDCRRPELRAFLEAAGVPFVHDASNDDVGVPRNRVRAELLPLLEARFNSRITDVLAAEADIAREEHAYLDSVAIHWLREQSGDRGTDVWSVNADALAALPLALSRRVAHRALSDLAGGRLIGFDDVERMLATASGLGAAFDGPGLRVERVGADVVLSSRPDGAGRPGRRTAEVALAPFHHALAVPGVTPIPEIGCALSVEEVAGAAASVAAGDELSVAVSNSVLAAGLFVRNRRPGDRLKPSPAGHRKLQDLLVDRKVPRAERDRVAVVVDADGRIVWVAGHAVDWDFRVVDPAQAVVVLRLKAVGGSF